jgi:histidinol-phosphatase
VSESPEVLVEAATELARRVGLTALRRYHPSISVETKADGSPVTAADRAAEREAQEWISARFPEDGTIGEEFGVHRPDARRRWIIDPIDGTKSFVRGVPLWGSLVAVAEGDTILAGAAFFPALNELIAAGPKVGCWWNGTRSFVSSIDSLRNATALTTDEQFGAAPEHREGWSRLASECSFTRSWGDCYGYLLVATGRAEVMVDGRLSEWDAAAFLPVIEEAGGVFTDWSGRRTAFGGSAIATNAALAVDARARLRR